jgi:hypothetical protein
MKWRLMKDKLKEVGESSHETVLNRISTLPEATYSNGKEKSDQVSHLGPPALKEVLVTMVFCLE